MQAIRRARQEPLDFQAIELNVFELAAHYVFYCLERRKSPKFGRMPKLGYITELRQFAQLGQTIRVGKSRLSVLVNKAESCVSNKAELAKLVEKLEATDEF